METPDDILTDVRWYADNAAKYLSSRRRVSQWIKDNGPVRLPDGRMVGYFAAGTDWDHEAIAEVLPQLITKVVVAFECTGVEQAERVMSIAIEEMPTIQVESVKHTLDRAAANGVLRAGGEAAEKLRECKADRTTLQVR